MRPFSFLLVFVALALGVNVAFAQKNTSALQRAMAQIRRSRESEKKALSLLELLQNAKVETDLNLDRDQKSEVAQAYRKLSKQRREVNDTIRRLPPQQWFQKKHELMQQIGKQSEKKVKAILEPKQLVRFNQIRLQLKGIQALQTLPVQTELKITEEQNASFAELQQAAAKSLGKTVRELRGNGRMNIDKIGEAQQKLKGKQEKDMLAVLTREQREKFDIMKGKKIELGAGISQRRKRRRGVAAQDMAKSKHAKTIAAIKKWDGEVRLDQKLPGRPVIMVEFYHFSKVTDAWLVHLKPLTKLQYVGLRGTKITDAGVAHLKGLPDLHSLNLGSTKVTDAGLVHLKGLTKLKTLALGWTKVSNAGLAHLKGLTKLQSLSFRGEQITDSGLVHLKGLEELERLGLSSTKISDAGIVHLTGLSKLRYLYLQGTNVTDAGIVQLKGLSKLRLLNLRATKVTDAGVKKLQAALPNCRIIF